MNSQDSFRLVFASVLAITLACLVVSVLITPRLLPESPSAKSLNDTVLSVFKLGFSAIVGLLGWRGLN